MATPCPFCDMGDRVLKDNNLANAFLSNPRKVPGHFLVTPKRHVEKPWDLTDDELLAMFELIFLIQRRLTDKLGVGCDVTQNYRPFMKQGKIKVDHLHFHVYPRTADDQLYQIAEQAERTMFTQLPEAERLEFSSLLG